MEAERTAASEGYKGDGWRWGIRSPGHLVDRQRKRVEKDKSLRPEVQEGYRYVIPNRAVGVPAETRGRGYSLIVTAEGAVLAWSGG